MSHQFYFSPHILDNLPVPAAGFDVVRDLAEPNLQLYITRRGVKSFFVRKRVGGRDRRIIIGNWPALAIDDARDKACGVLKSAAAGARRVNRKRADFEKIVNMYMAAKVRRGELERAKLMRSIKLHLSSLMNKGVADITSSDIGLALINIRGAAVRNRTQELLRSIFNFALDNGYVKSNPTASLPRVQEARRARPNIAGNVEKLLNAINAEPDEILRAAFLMLIYGFAPKGRIFSMRWDDIDFNQYTWGGAPLCDRAAVVLESLPQSGEWVFPARGGRHITDPRMTWRRVARTAGMPALTMDDVHKFMMRQLSWSGAREQLRDNMNNVVSVCYNFLTGDPENDSLSH